MPGGRRARTRYAVFRSSSSGCGCDHTFVFDHSYADNRSLLPAVTLVDPGSSRTLDVTTTQPGAQVSSDNVFGGSDVGTSDRMYRQDDGIALETQHVPDSPNQHQFPSPVLRPGEELISTTDYAVSTA